jgi:hypothetical protein
VNRVSDPRRRGRRESCRSRFGKPSRLRSSWHHRRSQGRAKGHALSARSFAARCVRNCDDCDPIAAWSQSRLSFLCGFLPHPFGAPGGRWLRLLMNRNKPAVIWAPFTCWGRRRRLSLGGEGQSIDIARGSDALVRIRSLAARKLLLRLGQRPRPHRSTRRERRQSRRLARQRPPIPGFSTSPSPSIRSAALPNPAGPQPPKCPAIANPQALNFDENSPDGRPTASAQSPNASPLNFIVSHRRIDIGARICFMLGLDARTLQRNLTPARR